MDRVLMWLIGLMPIATLALMGSDWVIKRGYGPYLFGFGAPIVLILITGVIPYLSQKYAKKRDNSAGP